MTTAYRNCNELGSLAHYNMCMLMGEEISLSHRGGVGIRLKALVVSTTEVLERRDSNAHVELETYRFEIPVQPGFSLPVDLSKLVVEGDLITWPLVGFSRTWHILPEVTVPQNGQVVVCTAVEHKTFSIGNIG